MNRTAFLVDGFNLYHSLIDASRDLGGVSTKWLNIHSLCNSFLSDVGGGSQVSEIVYFSALATYREAADPNVTSRHRTYIECLRSTGVQVELGQFKEKRWDCWGCGQEITRHEEKETDVAIGVKLLELFWLDRCDSAVLVTGDSDLAPAVRMAQKHFPGKGIFCCFPYKRIGFELKSLAKKSFRIRARRCLLHQFPNPVVLRDGRQLQKPPKW